MKKMLLPFTQCVDMDAIEDAVRLAKSHNAVLVPLSLMYVSEKSWKKGPRLEQVQQSKDFLEAVRCKAAKYGVQTQRFEVTTSNVTESINLLNQELGCDAVQVFVRPRGTVLLQAREIKDLLEQSICKLYIVYPQREDVPGGIAGFMQRIGLGARKQKPSLYDGMTPQESFVAQLP
jgi:hypothetical protein